MTIQARETTLLAEREALEARLASLLASKTSYKLGDQSFDWNQTVAQIRQRLVEVKAELESLPWQEESVYDDPDR